MFFSIKLEFFPNTLIDLDMSSFSNYLPLKDFVKYVELDYRYDVKQEVVVNAKFRKDLNKPSESDEEAQEPKRIICPPMISINDGEKKLFWSKFLTKFQSGFSVQKIEHPRKVPPCDPGPDFTCYRLNLKRVETAKENLITPRTANIILAFDSHRGQMIRKYIVLDYAPKFLTQDDLSWFRGSHFMPKFIDYSAVFIRFKIPRVHFAESCEYYLCLVDSQGFFEKVSVNGGLLKTLKETDSMAYNNIKTLQSLRESGGLDRLLINASSLEELLLLGREEEGENAKLDTITHEQMRVKVQSVIQNRIIELLERGRNFRKALVKLHQLFGLSAEDQTLTHVVQRRMTRVGDISFEDLNQLSDAHIQVLSELFSPIYVDKITDKVWLTLVNLRDTHTGTEESGAQWMQVAFFIRDVLFQRNYGFKETDMTHSIKKYDDCNPNYKYEVNFEDEVINLARHTQYRLVFQRNGQMNVFTLTYSKVNRHGDLFSLPDGFFDSPFFSNHYVRLIYVMLPSHELIVSGERFSGINLRLSHSQLARGGPVLAAGELVLHEIQRRWYFREINNSSGHYALQADIQVLKEVEELLRKHVSVHCLTTTIPKINVRALGMPPVS